MRKFDLEVAGNVGQFENLLLEKSEQEFRAGIEGNWTKMADYYAIQLEIIRYVPIPETADSISDDELPPVFHTIYEQLDIKLVDKETIYPYLFFRWGLKVRTVGNYRIIYCVHNYYKVVLLHFFEKSYNGNIRRKDLLPAELEYEKLCYREPVY